MAMLGSVWGGVGRVPPLGPVHTGASWVETVSAVLVKAAVILLCSYT